jgi:hypothetical protein
MTGPMIVDARRIRHPDPDAAISRIDAILADQTGDAVTLTRDELLDIAHVAREGRREAQAVWRCAISDFVGCLDILRDRWKASRRKHEREAGERLSVVLDAVYAGRNPAPHDHRSATKAGKDLVENVRTAMMSDGLKRTMEPIVEDIVKGRSR